MSKVDASDSGLCETGILKFCEY